MCQQLLCWANYLPINQHLSILSFLRRIISSKLWLIRSNSNIIPEWGDIFLLNLVIRERIQPFRKLIYLTARVSRSGWSSVRSIVKVFEWLDAFLTFPIGYWLLLFSRNMCLRIDGALFLACITNWCHRYFVQHYHFKHCLLWIIWQLYTYS